LGEAESSAEMKSISSFSSKFTKANAANNPYCNISIEEAEVTFAQYKSFLSSKLRATKEQLETKKNRGITQAQHDEWKRQFDAVDKDKSGNLSPDEFRNVLFTLGEKRKPEEIEKLIAEYGNADKKISFDSFKQFMIRLHGQSMSKEEIANSFALINRNQPTAALDAPHFVNALGKDKIAYLQRHAPKTANGEVDIQAFINHLFSK